MKFLGDHFRWVLGTVLVALVAAIDLAPAAQIDVSAEPSLHHAEPPAAWYGYDRQRDLTPRNTRGYDERSHPLRAHVRASTGFLATKAGRGLTDGERVGIVLRRSSARAITGAAARISSAVAPFTRTARRRW